jgi:hypothetical protein
LSIGTPHRFHIPVMGLGYTIDTPLKVARFGIDSVVSIMEDHLVERMRELHSGREGEPYVPIPTADVDHRAKRITAYLNLLNRAVHRQVQALRAAPFGDGGDLDRYFELLPDSSPARAQFARMRAAEPGAERSELERALRAAVVPGAIDVNVMTKCDRTNHDDSGRALPAEYTDARAALRGFALSDLESSVVFSAGLNPRLYTYCEEFADFFPDAAGRLRKKITLKVSDYRSASVQGRFLAKKGLWVSEFRIESGLNCGGHAFATQGTLLGPVLGEFSRRRAELHAELLGLCNRALGQKGSATFTAAPAMRVTVQGGIGTAAEHEFLIARYGVDATGWGSPFLLVPEVTNVDADTLRELTSATPDDYVLSDASPLGIPFSNFRKSSSERLRRSRVAQGRPGSPCYKKFLAFNSEFTSEPICTASRQYQHHKLKQLQEQELSVDGLGQESEAVEAKECLCEGLGASALLKNGLEPSHGLSAVSICPGPNLAYFSRVSSLREMVAHIYGRANVLNGLARPHMFVNELMLYVEYLEREIARRASRNLAEFKANLLSGISYYRTLGLAGTAEALDAIERGLVVLDVPESAARHEAPAG